MLTRLGKFSPKSRSTFFSLMPSTRCPLLSIFSRIYAPLREPQMYPRPIISNQVPLKCKDSGPTISIVVGNHTIHRAFLNLGASVNLLPFTIYERLSLGELKSTKMVLQLADRSTRLPRELIEDVLVKVGTLYTQLILWYLRPRL